MHEDPQPGPMIEAGPGVPGGPTPAPPRTVLKLPASIWLKVLPAFVLALVAISIVPMKAAQPGVAPGTGPSLQLMFLVALLVSGITAAALYWCVTKDLGLATRIAILAVAYNVLIVVVKFALAPEGLYEVNRTKDLQSVVVISSGIGAAITAAAVLSLYLIAYLVIYRQARARLGAPVVKRGSKERVVKGVLISSAILVAIGVVIPGAVVLLFLLAAGVGTGLEYLTFVFSSGAALLIALALAGAVTLAALAFVSVADRAKLIGDAAVLVSIFWLGLWFLVLYHVLWVVYILVITSIWPLRVVVPK